MRDKVRDELAACPFCGSTDIYDAYGFMVCNTCKATGPAMNNGNNDDHADFVDHKRAIEAWDNRQSHPVPSPASVQSAEELLAYIVKSAFSKFMMDTTKGEVAVSIDGDNLKKHIAEQLATQRQIGRDEVQEKAENIIVDLRKRYSTVVEAAKVYLKEHSCSDSHGVCQDETNLRKALSDLDTEAPQDAKE